MRGIAAAVIGIASVAAATLVSAEPPAGAAACSGCHPSSARASTPVARLTGRDRVEIVKAMQDFRSGVRSATVMDRIAKGFTDAEIEAIAAWFAEQK
ncbi:MAG TPA: cytochrome C [Methylomirabilota bacterium]|jgi:cytochrome c553